MCRLLALAMLLAAAPAAPVPKEKAGSIPLYFPTQIGATWVYQTGFGREEVRVVRAVEWRGDTAVVTVGTRQTGKEEAVERVEVSRSGLLQTWDGELCSQPEWVLKLPHTPGEQWRPSPGETSTSLGMGEVEVPAGRFWAARVNTAWMVCQDRMEMTCWYAPRVGLVKTVVRRGSGDCELVCSVLVSFTPGGD